MDFRTTLMLVMTFPCGRAVTIVGVVAMFAVDDITS